MERTTKGRTNWLKTILIALGAVCLIALVVSYFFKRMGPLPTLTDRDIAGETTITSQWLELKPDPVLQPLSKTPLVILELEGDYAPDFDSQRLRYPDGSLGGPDVQLVDEQGDVFPLHLLMVQHLDRSGSRALGGAGFGTAELPSGRGYAKVRIRSDKPMNCSRIIWRR